MWYQPGPKQLCRIRIFNCRMQNRLSFVHLLYNRTYMYVCSMAEANPDSLFDSDIYCTYRLTYHNIMKH